jgi:hypothetical protein
MGPVAQRPRDQIKRGLLLVMRYRDSQAPSARRPSEREEGTARALDGHQLIDQFLIDMPVEFHDKARGRPLNQATTLPCLAVALDLQLQSGVIETAVRRHRQLSGVS